MTRVRDALLMGMRVAIVLGVLLVAGCERPPADVSALSYRVVDEGRATGDCAACVIAVREGTCATGGQAADVAWHLPPALRAAAVRVEAERADGGRVPLAQGGTQGRAALSVALQPGDRVSLFDAGSGKELAFTRVDAPIGCQAAEPAAGR